MMIEVISMGKPVILVGSVTYAMKGRELLSKQGIRAYVERIPGGAGCGYGLYVPRDTEEAARILGENGVKILGREDREVGP